MTLRYQMNQCARMNELFMILRLCLPLLALVGAAQDDSLGSYLHHFCDGGNFTYYSDYQINLNHLVFGQFPDKGGARLFYNATQGDHPDQVHGLFLCRGDMSAADCKSCVKQASQEVLIRRCAGTRAAMIWFDGCFIRYASTPFGSTLDRKPEYYIWDAGNVSEPWSAFDLAVTNMFRDLTELATSDQRFYATAEAPVSGSLRVYGLAQCTPDISRSDCKTCLETPIGSMFRSVQGREGGRYMNPSCNLRYDIYSFTSRGARLSNDSGGNGSKGGQTLGIAVGISVSVALLFVLSVAYLSYSKRRRRKQIQGEKRSIVQEVTLGRSLHDEGSSRTPRKSLDLPLMNFSLISAATRHFSDENKLGEGGFGPVYKGTLPDGQDIAVKRHTRTSDQGLQEYENEVSLIANLQHRNLVKLIGCCLEGKELLLIYEYMPNKSLDLILFDPARSIKLNWRMRFSIINGIARGILYLHEDSRLRIIHRDLKASNVLLDHDMNPKISDFGMARIFYSNQNAFLSLSTTGIYTGAMFASNTGYMAPEYAMEGLFSVKSDVYSFGVLLLEIISGRRNTGFHFSRHGVSLLSYAWTLWSESETHGLELVDPSLNPSYISSEVLKCIHIALLCVQDDPADRPTMSSVVLMLGSENTVCLRQPSQPSFSVQRFARKRADTTPEDMSTSINDITVSSVSPR